MQITITTDDSQEAKRLVRADDLCSCLFDIQQHLRDLRKRPDKVTVKKLEGELWEIMSDIQLEQIYS